MSTMRKALKVLSLLARVGGIDLAITLVNAADVVLAILNGTAVVSVVVNALIIAGISYCASAVAKESLH